MIIQLKFRIYAKVILAYDKIKSSNFYCLNYVCVWFRCKKFDQNSTYQILPLHVFLLSICFASMHN